MDICDLELQETGKIYSNDFLPPSRSKLQDKQLVPIALSLFHALITSFSFPGQPHWKVLMYSTFSIGRTIYVWFMLQNYLSLLPHQNSSLSVIGMTPKY
jgi:hypothetical protein